MHKKQHQYQISDIKKHELIEVVKSDYPVTVYPDNNLNHEAQVQGYIIRFGVGEIYTNKVHCIDCSPSLTIGDLKELRKVIRKTIKNYECKN